MKRFTEILSGSTVMIFHVALTGWLFCMAQINNGFAAMKLDYLPLCAVLLAAYYIDRLMMRKAAPVPVFALIQIAFIALGAWVFTKCVHLEPHKTGTVVLNCIIYCMGFIIAGFIAWMPTNENGVLMRFDGMAVMLIILLVLDEILTLPASGGALGICALSLLLCLLSSVSMRSGHLAGRGSAVQGESAAGRLMLGLVLALMAALSALLLIFASGGMKSFFGHALQLIKNCGRALKTALLWLYTMLERFMVWLSGFFSTPEMEAIPMGQGAAAPPEVEGAEMVALPGWLYPALIVLGVLLLAYAIFRMRHLKLGKMKNTAAAVCVQKRSSGLKKALHEFLRNLCSAVVFRWHCISRRRSAPALLVWCEKKVEPELGRRCGESGEAFLRRIAAVGYPDRLSRALKELALCVERSFYSPVPADVPDELFRDIRRCKFKIEKNDAELQ